jgi:pimeloyl-ACP methyl ester carboxylesterase
MWGKFDRMTPPKAAQDFIKLSANAQVVYLPGGHQPINETPEEMLASLQVF